MNIPESGAARLLAALVLWPLLSFGVPLVVPPPAAVGLASPPRMAASVEYLVDDSWLDDAGERQLSQEIFARVLDLIASAESLVLVDMFLFNDWQGPSPERHRALAEELAAALRKRMLERPELLAVLITDPINTVYGGLESARLASLEAAGVNVVLTDLVPLQDSNPLWSGVWRWFIRPFGNAPADTLPNPLGPGRVSLRSWLALANFKANHRKLLVSDDRAGQLRALVTSANPHDGSSAHRNTALVFDGAAVADLLAAESALLALSSATTVAREIDARLAWLADSKGASEDVERHRAALQKPESSGSRPASAVPASGDASESDAGATVQILGESRIHDAVVSMLDQAGSGDRVDLAMFYLSDRHLVKALRSAASRGADVRVLLDVNRDAFGRAKNGVPNRPVAAELVAGGVAVRWCETRGEQCHAKQLLVDDGERVALLLGSGNYTRRNLHDRNLETDALLSVPASHLLADETRAHFDRLWNNPAGRTYSREYEVYADERLWLKVQYRVMEASGLSTF